MDTVVRTAQTVEEAEELALKELGVDRSEVEVEVLSRGKAGFLGIGAEQARVRITRISEAGNAAAVALDTEAGNAAAVALDTEAGSAAAVALDTEAGSAAAVALDKVNKTLAAAKVNVVSTLRAAHDPEVGGPIIDLTGEDSGLLIGRRGQTLQALQFLVNLMVRQEYGDGVRVMLDVESYRQRREASLRDMAPKVADRVVQTGRSITLEPMSPADRRIIHVSLADHETVSTQSMGEGEERKVTVLPKPSV